MTELASIPLGTLPAGAPASRLALHCGESHVIGAVNQLLGQTGDAGAIDRIMLPGGSWGIAEAASLSEGRIKRLMLGGRIPVKQAVEAVLGPRSLREVILIGHQDCAWYRELEPRASAGQLVRAQGQDMLRARDEILRWAPRSVTVSGWMLVSDESGATTARRLY
ncbi:MAG TPA: hypothetical protein VFY90_12705 [Tepidiformaceae bacterium]|nr:hypothetical protein [Tepidiformaceae bacterium]